ncbi:MAG: sodium-translocating pyrophosphatase [Candidatus Aenigmarchaeota archaeon]|nr:sodium-translocating pyrophosphatase [Candidatus Aenigmarchaeota archaeon]
MLEFPLAAGVVSLAFALGLAFYINKQPRGTPKMIEIHDAIRQGSKAYLKRQYKSISIIAAIVAVLLYFAFDFNTSSKMPLTSFAFIFGAASSLIAGFVSMDVATRANVRATFAARKNSRQPLKIAFYGGMVMGLFNVALSLLGITTLYYFYGKPELIIGFGFGASLAALFAQLGGGIFTKAADVGADLVGKIEAGIPEDDPRNAAVIADNVGDNVGDCAGRGADLFESTAGENIAAMLLGSLVALVTGNALFVIFPLLARALGIFATLFGFFFVRGKEGQNAFKPLRNGVIATTVFLIVAFYFLVNFTLHNINLYYSALVGVIASMLILLVTEYYTGTKYRPVQDIANASKTGVATNIITGYAVSLETTALPVVIIAGAILASFYFGGLFAADTGVSSHLGGVYGTAVATMGMLAVAGMVLGLDGFGPIADNASGIAEMSGADKSLRKRLDPLDSVGNTTKALTKGYAMGSAGLAALLLFQAYIEITGVKSLDISTPKIIVGLFLGSMVPFLFASFAIRAVGKAAFKMVEEVRRQFRTIKGLMQGKAKPDYSRAVDISTIAAQKEMIIPGLMPVIIPIVIGFTLGADTVGAFLMGATFTGFILAMLMNTGGAAWDNAKKYIEAGFLGGKGSEAHKAAVVGDTFGDPQKDTAGPSLHVLIKLLGTISLTFGTLFVMYSLVH